MSLFSVSKKKKKKIISNKRNNLRTDRLDMSFGELMNMYEEDWLFITPEYQKAFRWDKSKQSKFIESILLGVPVPPIFVAETKEAKWEVLDGWQSIITIFSFFGILKESDDQENNWTLEKCEIITELEGRSIEDFSPLLKFTIKKTVCRVEIIKWDNDLDRQIIYKIFGQQ